jgi:magnesium-transporting ATPase (P-type)
MDHPITPQSFVEEVPLSTGLTSDEARRRLEKFGPNAVLDTTLHPLRRALTKFWAPVPWMLEAAIVLGVVLGKYFEAGVIAGLLVFNAALGYFQEGRAQATLAALKSRLALNASVRLDNVWATVPAAGLVPGDIVKLSLGAVVAAAVRLIGGEILLDQSMLTGESIPIEAGPSLQTYAGALGRPLQRLRRPERVQSLDVPRNWFARRTSKVPSRRPFCAWCAISPCSMASSSCCWWDIPTLSSCLLVRSFPWCSRRFWRQSQ